MSHLPELLALVASYQSRQEHIRSQTEDAPALTPLIHDRPSLAWCASHPVARLVAEMRGAERVVFYGINKGCGGADSSRPSPTALLLASTSTLPSEARHAVFAKKKDTAPFWRRWLRRVNFAEVAIVATDDEDEDEKLPEKGLDDDVGGPSPTMSGGLDFNSLEPNGQRQRRAVPPQSTTRNARKDCGVETAGLVSVLVSREYLLARKDTSPHRPAPPCEASEATTAHTYVSHRVPLPSLREWVNASVTDSTSPAATLAPYLPASEEDPFFLFAPATVTQEWLSLPEAASFVEPTTSHTAPAPAQADTRRHQSKTAAATYVASRFASAGAHRLDSSEPVTREQDAFVYRQLFIADEGAFSHLLLDASRWWLQRPIPWSELPRRCCPPHQRRASEGALATAAVTPTLHIKLVSDLFATSPLRWLAAHFMLCFYFVSDASRVTAKGLSSGPLRSLPWCAMTQWIEARWGCHRSEARAAASQAPNMLTALWWNTRVLACVVGGLLMCLLMTCFNALCCGKITWKLSASQWGSPRDPLRLAVQAELTTESPSERLKRWARLGSLYRSQLESLDLSYTGVTGDDVLALMQGAATAANRTGDVVDAAADAAASTFVLRTLDMCGCRCLHSQLSASSSDERATSSCDAVAGAVGNVLRWLPPSSSLGRALAIGTCCGGLQLVNACGSSMNDDALGELGHACLLLEATQLASSAGAAGSADVTLVRPSLLAMDLSSCDAVANLNPLAFVASLLQLLVAFSAVDSAGVACLDGSQYPATLAALLMPHVSSDRHARLAHQLLCEATSSRTATNAPLTPLADAHNDTQHPRRRAARDQLHQLFRSHFYHLDFAYCLPLDDINVLGQQRTLQYLNTSHCRMAGIGVRHLSRRPRGGDTTTHSGPPLRVVIAEFCDLLDSLEGLACLPCLKKLYVRSSSLTDEGLAALTTQGSPLELLELSYCPKIEVVSCLSRLPELRTLILDCTEIKRGGVKGLAACPKMEALSLRCCADFASVGTSKRVFDTHVVAIPTLKQYVYEDLIGDEAYREYE